MGRVCLEYTLLRSFLRAGGWWFSTSILAHKPFRLPWRLLESLACESRCTWVDDPSIPWLTGRSTRWSYPTNRFPVWNCGLAGRWVLSRVRLCRGIVIHSDIIFLYKFNMPFIKYIFGNFLQAVMILFKRLVCCVASYDFSKAFCQSKCRK